MKIKEFFRSNWPLFLIISVAAILRFWRLGELTTFSGDQGYDFLIVKRMIMDGHFTLLGPKIGPYNEIGNLYLGPAYYYLLAPALFLSRLDPIGPAILTVMLSLFTILFIYYFCLKFLSRQIGIFASLIYSFNTFLINQSRAASNPHLIPFFAILYIYSIFEIINAKVKQKIWTVIAGFSLGIMFQLHYLTLSLAPLLIIIAIKKKFKELLILIISFVLTISPQILFELRHKFFITSLFIKQLELGQNISKTEWFWSHLILSQQKLFSIFLTIAKPTSLIIALIISSLIIYLFKNKKHRLPIMTLIISTLIGLVSASFYSGSIELHYFASIYPAIVILLASILVLYLNLFNHYLIKGIILFIFIQIISTNLLILNLGSQEGYTMPKGWNTSGIKKASQIIAQDTNSNTIFNIASTLDGDTRARPLRYLVEVYGRNPQDVEHYPQSKSLYLVSRDEEDQILRYTVWEVASFYPFRIVQKWEIQNGIKLYKLVKSEQKNI